MIPAETPDWRRAHTYAHALAEITGRRTACVKIHGQWTTCWAGIGQGQISGASR